MIRLQDRVRALQLELGRYIDDGEAEHDTEESIRPGGLVRLEEGDETPRYLGPSSGIAMTRLVMEEARRYTDSRSIRELVPEVTKRRTPVQSPGSTSDFKHNERKRSYPIISAIPAVGRPSTLVRDKLIEVFNQKGESREMSKENELLPNTLQHNTSFRHSMNRHFTKIVWTCTGKMQIRTKTSSSRWLWPSPCKSWTSNTLV